jgi:hypothetical protein
MPPSPSDMIGEIPPSVHQSVDHGDVFKYVDDNNNKTTILLGLTALMEILPGVIDGFELHPLSETSTLPVLTSTCVQEGFPSSAILAFKYCHVKNKLPHCGNSQQSASFNLPAPSPYRHDDDEDFSPPLMLYGVIWVRGNENIKVACEEIGWDVSETWLQIRYKEHQSADSNAQILLMCVPNVFDWEGVEGEILWHFAEIEKSLLKKGALPAEFVGKPLTEIRVLWHQNKQGKGRSRAWLLQPWRALESYLLQLLPTLT